MLKHNRFIARPTKQKAKDVHLYKIPEHKGCVDYVVLDSAPQKKDEVSTNSCCVVS